MQMTNSHQRNNTHENRPVVGLDRRDKDRREKSQEGFIYIPMVGWYCRRNKARRCRQPGI